MRTFEEIIKELESKLGAFWSIEKLNKDYAVLANCYLDCLVVHINGRLEIYYRLAIHTSIDLHPDKLAAISAACSEIAESYHVEHDRKQRSNKPLYQLGA